MLCVDDERISVRLWKDENVIWHLGGQW